MIRFESFRRLIVSLTGLVLLGCTMPPVPPATQPSGMTQQLMMRSLERALASLDIERLMRQTRSPTQIVGLTQIVRFSARDYAGLATTPSAH